MNIFISATNHHLIQVNEAINYYNIQASDAILLFLQVGKDVLNRSLLSAQIPSFTFKSWIFKDIFFNKRLYKEYIAFLNNIKKRNNCIRLFTNQYYSDYSLLAYFILKPSETILMDEGTASFKVVIDRKEHRLINYKLLIKSLLYKKKLAYPKKLTFFTQYYLTVQATDKIQNYSFKKIENSITINNKAAIILGTSLTELGVVDYDRYLNILNGIHKYLSNNGYTVIQYYCHRKEQEQKLKDIEALGYSIVKNKIPFEFLFPQMKSCPGKIYCFMSPILDSISKQYANIPEFIIIHLEGKDLKTKNLKLYKEIYNNYKHNPSLQILNI